ncbi:MAG: hypothetical protein U0521_23400 [Anaerolineae bacterium]
MRGAQQERMTLPELMTVLGRVLGALRISVGIASNYADAPTPSWTSPAPSWIARRRACKVISLTTWNTAKCGLLWLV